MLSEWDVFHVAQLAPSAIEQIKDTKWDTYRPEHVTHTLNLSSACIEMHDAETPIHVEYDQVRKHFEQGWLCDVSGILVELCKMKQSAVIKNKHGEQLKLRVCEGLVEALESHEGTEFHFGNCEVSADKVTFFFFFLFYDFVC